MHYTSPKSFPKTASKPFAIPAPNSAPDPPPEPAPKPAPNPPKCRFLGPNLVFIRDPVINPDVESKHDSPPANTTFCHAYTHLSTSDHKKDLSDLENELEVEQEIRSSRPYVRYDSLPQRSPWNV
jgi:hypothetical protein